MVYRQRNQSLWQPRGDQYEHQFLLIIFETQIVLDSIEKQLILGTYLLEKITNYQNKKSCLQGVIGP